jgi:hypothetical protein
MPLIRDYNSDSNIYGLKGHSTFMSVCKFRSFMKRNLRSSHADSFSRSYSFLPDLRRRSIVPTAYILQVSLLQKISKNLDGTPNGCLSSERCASCCPKIVN